MIGEKLEEARKRKGVSIREAAEATKIRGEFLLSMEDNTFNIPLPEIYIRGFLKNYARFLKLDHQKLLTDYDARQLGRIQAQRAGRDTRESFGRMELQPPAPVDAAEDAPRTPPPPNLESEPTRSIRADWAENRELYIKAGVIFGGIAVLLVILVMLVRLITGGAASDSADVVTGSDRAPVSTTATASQAAAQTMVISASNTVSVIVTQTADRQSLFRGTLQPGERISLEKSGPVSIRFSDGAALLIEVGGRQVRPGDSGLGQTMID